MEIEQLRLFAAVIRSGSFSAVARVENVDPSSISRAISTLEDNLGVRLFQRTTRQIVPTEAGKTYYERIAPALAEIEEASLAARDAGREIEGNLRILAPAGFAQMNLLPLLPEFSFRHPKLTFEFILTDEELDLVKERIDLAVALWPIANQSYATTRLCPMREVICASPGYLSSHPRINSLEDIAEHRCVVFRQEGFRSLWRARDAAGKLSQVNVKPRYTFSNALALREATLMGLGPTLVPRWIVGIDLEDGKLINLLPKHDVTALEFDSAAAWLVFPTRAYLPLKVRALMDFLKQRFSQGAPGEAARPPASGPGKR